MPETFGARLCAQREQQGITLGAIAEQTKINSCLLSALERDDVSRWPSGIFRRAYFRSYAEAIGLDADVALREFLTLHPDPHDEVDTTGLAAVAAAADTARAASGPPTRLGMMLSSVMKVMARLGRDSSPVDVPASAPAPTESLAPTFVDSEPASPVEPLRGALSEFESESATGAAPAPALEPPPAIQTGDPIIDAVPETSEARFDVDFFALARVCTELGRARNVDEIQPLLKDASRILGAKGLIVWMPADDAAARLAPVLAHGYSRRVLARLLPVDSDADNPTAAAFRTSRVVGVSDEAGGALVVPLLGVNGCAGALALELPRGHEQFEAVRAAAAIVAAMLVQLIGGDASGDDTAAMSMSLPSEALRI